MFLVDSNVLLDIVKKDPRWRPWSEKALAQAVDTGPIAINQLIYAEVSVAYERCEQLDSILGAFEIAKLSLPWDAAFLAVKDLHRISPARGQQDFTPAGLLHRRARNHCGSDPFDSRCGPLPRLFPRATARLPGARELNHASRSSPFRARARPHWGKPACRGLTVPQAQKRGLRPHRRREGPRAPIGGRPRDLPLFRGYLFYTSKKQS